MNCTSKIVDLVKTLQKFYNIAPFGTTVTPPAET